MPKPLKVGISMEPIRILSAMLRPLWSGP